MIRRNVLNPYGLRAEQLLRRAEPIPGRPAPLDPKTGLAVRPTLDEQARVISTFDARPINARDFDFQVDAAGAVGNRFLSLTVPVPAGYVAVVRAVSWELRVDVSDIGPHVRDQYDVYGNEFRALPGVYGAEAILITLTSDGVPVQGFGGMKLGLSQLYLPTYFVVDQNKNIGITFVAPLGDGTSTFPLAWACFHGNLLPKTGRWVELEPGNLAGPALVGNAPISPAPVLTPPAVSARGGIFRPAVQTSAISSIPRGPLFTRGRKFWR